jgi:hypothetical protein
MTLDEKQRRVEQRVKSNGTLLRVGQREKSILKVYSEPELDSEDVKARHLMEKKTVRVKSSESLKSSIEEKETERIRKEEAAKKKKKKKLKLVKSKEIELSECEDETGEVLELSKPKQKKLRQSEVVTAPVDDDEDEDFSRELVKRMPRVKIQDDRKRVEMVKRESTQQSDKLKRERTQVGPETLKRDRTQPEFLEMLVSSDEPRPKFKSAKRRDTLHEPRDSPPKQQQQRDTLQQERRDSLSKQQSQQPSHLRSITPPNQPAERHSRQQPPQTFARAKSILPAQEKLDVCVYIFFF